MKNLLVQCSRHISKYKRKISGAYNIGYWRDEFRVAESLDLDCIGLFLDFDEAEENAINGEWRY